MSNSNLNKGSSGKAVDRAPSDGLTDTVVFDFGSMVVNAGDNLNGEEGLISVHVYALVPNVPENVAAAVMTARGVFDYGSGLTVERDVSFDIVEGILNPVQVSTNITSGDAGDAVLFTITVGHNGLSSAAAHDLVITDVFNTNDVVLQTGSVNVDNGGVVSRGNSGSDSTVMVNVTTLALGNSLTITFEVVLGTKMDLTTTPLNHVGTSVFGSSIGGDQKRYTGWLFGSFVEDEPLNVDLSKAGLPSGTFSLQNATQYGSVTFNNQTNVLSYSNNPDYVGRDTFTGQFCIAPGQCGPLNGDFSVVNVNDAPRVSFAGQNDTFLTVDTHFNRTVSLGIAFTDVDFLGPKLMELNISANFGVFIFSEVPTNSLKYIVGSPHGNASFVRVQGSSLDLQTVLQSAIYQPFYNHSGNDSVSVSIRDEWGLTDQINMTVFIIRPPAPQVIGFEAYSEYALDRVFGTGDVLKITFDKATDSPAVQTKEQIDRLIKFSHSIGRDYNGTWVANGTILEIRIVDGSDPMNGDSWPLLMNISRVKIVGDILDEAKSTLPSRAESPKLTGNFGTYSIRVTQVQLEDVSTLIVFFNENVTANGTVWSKEEVLNVLQFSLDPSKNFTGVWLNSTVLKIEFSAPLLPQDLNNLNVTIGGEQEAVGSSNVAQGGGGQGNVGLVVNWPTGPVLLEFFAFDPLNNDASYDKGDKLMFVFSEPTNKPAMGTKDEIDLQLSFNIPIGANYTGQWLNGTHFEITITETANPRPSIGSTSVTPLGGIRNEAETSLASAGSVVLTGAFGLLQGPKVIGVTASDPVNLDAVMGPGDFIDIRFDEPTNQPYIESDEAVRKIFNFSEPINYIIEARWLNPQWARLKIVLFVNRTTNATAPTANTTVNGSSSSADTEVVVKNTGRKLKALSVEKDPDAVRLQNRLAAVDPQFGESAGANFNTGPQLDGSFKLSLLPGIRVANGDSLDSTGTFAVNGSWGLGPAPCPVSVTADDPDAKDFIFSAGDTITIVFANATNTVAMTSKEEIDQILFFSSKIANNYTGRWTDLRTYEIELLDVKGVDPIPLDGSFTIGTRARLFNESGGLRLFGSLSLTSTCDAPLKGKWGPPAPCEADGWKIAVVSIVALVMVTLAIVWFPVSKMKVSAREDAVGKSRRKKKNRVGVAEMTTGNGDEESGKSGDEAKKKKPAPRDPSLRRRLGRMMGGVYTMEDDAKYLTNQHGTYYAISKPGSLLTIALILMSLVEVVLFLVWQKPCNWPWWMFLFCLFLETITFTAFWYSLRRVPLRKRMDRSKKNVIIVHDHEGMDKVGAGDAEPMVYEGALKLPAIASDLDKKRTMGIKPIKSPGSVSSYGSGSEEESSDSDSETVRTPNLPTLKKIRQRTGSNLSEFKGISPLRIRPKPKRTGSITAMEVPRSRSIQDASDDELSSDSGDSSEEEQEVMAVLPKLDISQLRLKPSLSRDAQEEPAQIKPILISGIGSVSETPTLKKIDIKPLPAYDNEDDVMGAATALSLDQLVRKGSQPTTPRLVESDNILDDEDDLN